MFVFYVLLVIFGCLWVSIGIFFVYMISNFKFISISIRENMFFMWNCFLVLLCFFFLYVMWLFVYIYFMVLFLRVFWIFSVLWSCIVFMGMSGMVVISVNL